MVMESERSPPDEAAPEVSSINCRICAWIVFFVQRPWSTARPRRSVLGVARRVPMGDHHPPGAKMPPEELMPG